MFVQKSLSMASGLGFGVDGANRSLGFCGTDKQAVADEKEIRCIDQGQNLYLIAAFAAS